MKTKILKNKFLSQLKKPQNKSQIIDTPVIRFVTYENKAHLSGFAKKEII